MTPLNIERSVARTGIVGCGQIGSRFDEGTFSRNFPKTHAATYKTVPGFDLVSICDTDPDRLETCQQYWRINAATTNVDEFIKKNLDIVSICTPPSERLDLIEKIFSSSQTRIIF